MAEVTAGHALAGGAAVLVRAFADEDVAAMLPVWNGVVEAANAFPQTDPMDEVEARAFFAQQSRTAVAVGEGGEVLGLYILHPNNVGRCAHVANASYAVAAGVRGRGIGRALVEDSLAQLTPLGFSGLQFNAVVASNKAAQRLYESLGFARVGTIPGGFENGAGVREDILIYYHDAE